ncbi:acetyltransferase [Bacillus thuringiensis]|nr:MULTISPECIES: CatB-related O-acetyltransferase [Bacillus cereus group]PFB22163.1 acetyltransferase [Bacillus cereus]PGA28950.1 acetyltransferase [Bacillus thuringiensis]
MFLFLKRILKRVYVYIRFKNVIIGSRGNISTRTIFEGQNKVGRNAWFDGYMGYGSYIGDGSTINGEVGRYCSIGHQVTVLTGTHPSHVFVSTSPVFYSTRKQNGTTYTETQRFEEIMYSDKENRYGVTIGNDVWIGFQATIIGGVKIGDGAIIASNAVVTKDVAPYTIVAGIPAKEVGRRFDEDTIRWLCNFKWWNKPEEWIKNNAEIFTDINLFKKNMQK